MVTHYCLHDSVLYSTRVSGQRKANQSRPTAVGPALGCQVQNEKGEAGSVGGAGIVVCHHGRCLNATTRQR